MTCTIQPSRGACPSPNARPLRNAHAHLCARAWTGARSATGGANAANEFANAFGLPALKCEKVAAYVRSLAPAGGTFEYAWQGDALVARSGSAPLAAPAPHSVDARQDTLMASRQHEKLTGLFTVLQTRLSRLETRQSEWEATVERRFARERR